MAIVERYGRLMDISSAGRAATIAIEVTVGGVDQAGARLTALGTQGEAAANRVQKAYQQVAASAMDFARAGANAAQIAQLTGSSMTEARNAATLYAKTLATTEEEIRGVQLANQELATAGFLQVQKAAAATTPNLNSLRASMTSFAGSTLQTVPGVAQLASALGNFAIGAGPMVAALAGVAALTAAWKAWTEGAGEAKKAQEELTTSLLKWYDTQKQGAAGEFPKQIAAATAQIKELRAELDKMNGGGVGAIASSVGAGGSRVSAWIRAITGFLGSGNTVQLAAEMVKGTAATVDAVKKRGDAIVAAQQEVTKRLEKAAQDQAEALAAAAGDTIDKINAGNDAYRRQYNAEIDRTLAKLEEEIELEKELARERVEAAGEAQRAAKAMYDAETEATNKAVEEQRKYSEDIGRIWRDGIGKIATDGFKSFHDFFEDVFQLFTRLLDRMAAAGKGGSFGANLLGLGASAIGGGLAGYQSGSFGAGIFAGGASGFAIGGPVGAAAGALAGAAGGLLGAAQKQKEAAEAQRQAAKDFQLTITGFRASLGTSVQQQLFGITQQTAGAQAYITGNQPTGLQGYYGKFIGTDYGAGKNKQDQAELDEIIKQLTQKIRDDFLGSIAEAYNATRGPAGEYENALNAIKKSYDDAVASAKALGLGQDVLDKIEAIRLAKEQQLADAIAATAKAAADAAAEWEEARRLLNKSAVQDYQLRYLTATGDNDAAFYYRQQLEYSAAIAKDLDGATLIWLRMAQAAEAQAYEQAKADADAQRAQQAQGEALQQQQRVLEQQLNAQQEIVNNTRQTIDALRKYSDSLKLGNLTPLGPEERYNEAKRQYLSTANAAAAGDLTAAGNLPGAANAFLEQSRNMFASSQRYADDFKMVQTFVGSLIDQYGAQLTVEERMLAELRAQNAALQAQIEAQRATTKAVEDSTKTFKNDVVPLLRDPPWFKDFRDELLGRRPGTGDPVIGPRRTGGGDATTHAKLDELINHLYNMRQQNTSIDDKLARTNTTIGQVGGTTIERLERIRDNTKATSDGVSRLRPEIDVGGTVH